MSTLAERQLAAWQAIARDWPTRLRPDQRWPSVVECTACHKGILLATDEAGHVYQYSEDTQLALVVHHLRNFHSELDPDRPPPAL